MTKIASVVLATLSLFLGMFFFFIGFMKVSPQLNRDIHREIRKNFVRYAKVVPLASRFALKVSPKWYRLTVGYTELLCGVTLAFIPGAIKQWVNGFLMALTVGAVYTHWMIGDHFDKMVPALAFTAILFCRLILYYLLRRNQIEQNRLTAKLADSKPLDTTAEREPTHLQENTINKTETKTSTSTSTSGHTKPKRRKGKNNMN